MKSTPISAFVSLLGIFQMNSQKINLELVAIFCWCGHLIVSCKLLLSRDDGKTLLVSVEVHAGEGEPGQPDHEVTPAKPEVCLPKCVFVEDEMGVKLCVASPDQVGLRALKSLINVLQLT